MKIYTLKDRLDILRDFLALPFVVLGMIFGFIYTCCFMMVALIGGTKAKKFLEDNIY